VTTGQRPRADDDDLDDDEIDLIRKHRAKQGKARTVRVWEVPEEMFHKMFGEDDGDGEDDDGDGKPPGDGAKKRKGWFD
jgi:hypothetical protein